MDNQKKCFKCDIERAERNLLIISWLGVFSALSIISVTIWGLM